MKSNIYIFTVGHSNVPLATFLNKLKEHKIKVLVDVRTLPLSRFSPHFNKNALYKALANETIQYLWRGRNLGGRGINENYDQAIDELVALAKQGTQVCVMCVEKNFKDCHRFTMLTPSFETRGLLVVHIQYDEK